MASATEPAKVLCFLCTKAKGIYKCEGCSHTFCPKHSVDHRNELNKQLEEITVTHDLVHQTANQQGEDPQKHPLMQDINQWETKSIDLIQKTAEKMRIELLQNATHHTTQVKQKLQILSNELRHGCEENDFSEIDLRQWTRKLEQMKSELLKPTIIIIKENSSPLVKKIRITRQGKSYVFERVFNDAQIKEQGRLVIKGDSDGHTEIRGKGEYNSGTHALSFQVEQLEKNGWIFFGIISKAQSTKVSSFNSPSAYGWSNKNQIYVNGQDRSEQNLEVAQKDIIVLIIDCDQDKIELRNKRLNRVMELSVDIQKCPFPWQLHLNLRPPKTQVRIIDPFD